MSFGPRDIRSLYSGEGARLWERIESGRPASYWEENACLGRAREEEILLGWLREAAVSEASRGEEGGRAGQPGQGTRPERFARTVDTAEASAPEHAGGTSEVGELRGLRVLDAGCGRGGLARRLAVHGARVVGVDLSLPSLGGMTRPTAVPPPAFAVADFRDLAPALRGRLDAVVLREVVQDYPAGHRAELVRELAATGAPHLFLTLRRDTRWSPLVRRAWPDGHGGAVDPVPLLRRLHLDTPYRLARCEEVRRRSFASEVLELVAR